MKNNQNNKSLLRISEDLKRALTSIIGEMKDNRVSGIVSISGCDVSPDLSLCRVYVSYYSKNNQNKSENKALKCLTEASGFIKRELALRLKIRKIPELVFLADTSIDYFQKISDILDKTAALDKELREKSKTITFNETANILKSIDNVLIICHASPDGDTLGSGYALCRGLISLGKKARVYCTDKISIYFNFLTENVPNVPDFEPEFIVSVDVADTALFGDIPITMQKYFDNIDLCIDHHFHSNTFYADKTYLEDTSAATEIIYRLLKAINVEITKDIAAALYVGIATDTGCFRFSNTTSDSHYTAAELLKTGFDVAAINYPLFELKTKKRIELESYILQNIEFYFGGKCALIFLPYDISSDCDSEDINNIGALPRQIENVSIGIVAKEKSPDVWKISFRSDNFVDVCSVASHFGGGGHKRAAGCKITGSRQVCTDLIINYLVNIFK